MATIVNTLAPLGPVGWTFAQHQAAGYQGGTDYIIDGGTPIKAPVAGLAEYLGQMADGCFQVRITYTTGYAITVRELGSIRGSYPRQVALYDVIGFADNIMWPHIDATINGVRSRFEPLVNTTSTASTGTVTPINPPPATRKQEDLSLLFKATSAATGAGESVGTGNVYKLDSDGHIALMADSFAINTAIDMYGPVKERDGNTIIEAVKVARA